MAYQYEHANRLKQVTEGSLTTQFAYNGDGVRIAKTVSETTTDYVLDLAATLPVVISDTDAVYLLPWAFDHPQDRVTARIGIRLWKDHDIRLRTEDIIKAVVRAGDRGEIELWEEPLSWP